MNHHHTIQQKEQKLKEHEACSSRLYNQIKSMRRHHKLVCSDHAVIRYQERIRLRPVGEVLSELMNSKVIKYYEELGDGTYPTGEGSTRAVILNGVIVTVLK